MRNQLDKKRQLVYLPQLPKIGARTKDDVRLYAKINQARLDLVDKLIDAGFEVQIIGGHYSSLKTMVNVSQNADVYIFTPMTFLKTQHPNFMAEAAKSWFQFFSVITGIYIGSSQQYQGEKSKPFIVMDPDGQWKMAIQILKDFKAKGVFSSEVQQFCHVVTGQAQDIFHPSLNDKTILTLLNVIQQGKGKIHKTVPYRFPLQYDFQPGRRNQNRRHPFGVAIFGSATTKQKIYLQATEELAFQIACRGWRLVTGAGVEGCMGAADKGYYRGKIQFQKQNPSSNQKPAHIGVSTQQILCLQGPPEHLDQLIIAKDIYQRMEIMLSGNKSINKDRLLKDSVNIVLVCPGGVGTLHQLATMLRLAVQGGIMKYKRIVILDPPCHINKDQTFYESLIKILRKLNFDEYFDVANTPEQAMQICNQIYQSWRTNNQCCQFQSWRDLPSLDIKYSYIDN